MTGDARVLEVGCGSGEMAERINALPGVTLVATDYSDDFVELTAARGVDARQADICYLPFDHESFDVVYAGWMLDHVRDIDRALAEVRRVLRPGRHVRRRHRRRRRRASPTASPARPASGCCRAGSATYAARTSRPRRATSPSSRTCAVRPRDATRPSPWNVEPRLFDPPGDGGARRLVRDGRRRRAVTASR